MIFARLMKDRLFAGRLQLRELFALPCRRLGTACRILGAARRKLVTVSTALVLCTSVGCGENPYQPMQSPEDYYFAGPTTDQADPTEPSSAEAPLQPHVRRVAMISGEKYWEFESPQGPELQLLPPVGSYQPALSYVPTYTLETPPEQVESVVPALKEPAANEILAGGPIVESDAYNESRVGKLNVSDSAVSETIDSTIAIMLLPPIPMEIVSNEPPVESSTASIVMEGPSADHEGAEQVLADRGIAAEDTWNFDSNAESSDQEWSFSESTDESESEEIAMNGTEDEEFKAFVSEDITPPVFAREESAEEQRLALVPTPMGDLASEQEEALEEQEIVEAPSAITTGVMTGAKVNERAIAKIRRGYKLAGKGAYYAAKSEFIGVLQMISQAKDSKHGKPRRTIALAAGLRALEEAEDFTPQGAELDAEVPVDVVASGHRTPLDIDLKKTSLLPQQVMDRYFRYAQYKLGGSVAGEPAGSMALHALGKLHSQLGKLEPEQNPLAQRHAYAFQQAALMAHDGNHLAAHELGVLMAEAGHYQEASLLLDQVVQQQPHPTVLRNLARVQKELGNTQLAAATRARARDLERASGTTNGVAWVTPESFAVLGRQPAGVPGQSRPMMNARQPSANVAQRPIPPGQPMTSGQSGHRFNMPQRNY
ncbi:tetratricopeptide repeat protein [Adhaeretor mobilis]|uniref:Tetratricopeptide repeat protein n=1 Tax=Adhaeretor mobilis TaxID=1930276 RepID=A0A517MS79_9BACT|nr:hypothetical protein [Adhaeretor mobilis]QDS97637.1 hypothetical protein HG15A2_09010 [Adhaeretor mobilis]